MTSSSIRILGIVGSLRKGSFNRMAFNAAKKLVPEGATLEGFDLDCIPLFNQDVETSPPQAVIDFKAAIRAADAILFATPEYNYSVSGVLKNAIDWASRPYGDSAWSGKPAAIMGASIGTLGTARAQYHLRQMFVYLNIVTLNKPEVMITNAEKKFDNAGDLTDEKSREMIGRLLSALVVLTHRNK